MGSVPYFVWWISVQVFVFWETLSGALSNVMQQHNQIQLLNFINNKTKMYHMHPQYYLKTTQSAQDKISQVKSGSRYTGRNLTS